MSYLLRRPPAPRRGLRRGLLDPYVGGFAYGGGSYSLNGIDGLTTTYARNPVEEIPWNFVGYAMGGFFNNPVVAGLELVRLNVFSEARFLWQQLRNGRPGDLFGSAALSILETPWPGGTTGDLLTRMLLDADLAGNAYWTRVGDEMVRLRPDYVELILEPREVLVGGQRKRVGYRKLAYAYREGGKSSGVKPVIFLPDEVMHFAPVPDPLASYRGMSWLTPVIREIQADHQSTVHKQAFWENAATPNLAVSLKLEDPDLFAQFVDDMERQHAGAHNAYKTLYTAAGADVTVIGKDMAETDFSNVVGKGETRIALCSGIHPVVAGLSEGMQGSSLNAGNYSAAKRATADKTFRPLWRNVAGSAQTLVPAPPGARLWYDARDVAFLRDDASDLASVQLSEAQTIRQLVDAGYEPASVVSAVLANDWTALAHSGLYSVQLQRPGDQAASADAPTGGGSNA